jgi:cell division protein FtsZ
MPEVSELKPRITVFGVGGAGGNAVANMINSNLGGVEFVVANTDAQALAQSPSERRIQMGANVTQGLGAGSRPEIGRAAAEESLDEILENLANSHMAFVTAGMGGGTGTGAAPVIARAARDQGILTVGVITKPFQFEGGRRMRVAEAGISELQQFVDTLIIIPNQNLFRIANERTTFAEAFSMADEVLHSGVRGITDLMVMPGLINLDFADIRAVMNEMGKAMMGTGEAEGEKRAVEAAESAISNPLLDEVSMKGARGVIINITGGMDLTLFEVDEAANRIRSEVDPDANIIVGSTFDEALNGVMRVSVVATGIDVEEMEHPLPQSAISVVETRVAQQMASSSGFTPVQPNPVNASIEALAVRVQNEGLGAPIDDAGPTSNLAPQDARGLSVETPVAAAQPQATASMEATAQAVEVELPAAAAELAVADAPPAARKLAPEPRKADAQNQVHGELGGLTDDGRAAPEPEEEEALLMPRKSAGSRRASLLERMAGGITRAAQKAGSQSQKRRTPPAKPVAENQVRTPEAARAPDDPERLFPADEDDQLEIPAFLRRQAN